MHNEIASSDIFKSLLRTATSQLDVAHVAGQVMYRDLPLPTTSLHNMSLLGKHLKGSQKASPKLPMSNY